MASFQINISTQTLAPVIGSAGGSERPTNFLFGPAAAPSCFARFSGFERKVLPSHFQLFGKGQEGDFVYLLHSGVVKLVNEGADGTKSILGLRASGCILDLSSALLGTPHHCSAITVTRTVVTCVPAEEFRRVLGDDPHFAREVNQILTREINMEEALDIEFRSSSVSDRLERLLHEFKESSAMVAPALARIVSIKQTEVAQMLSVTPSHLSRLLRKLPQTGAQTPAEQRRSKSSAQ
jgi:CRP-like cAMP-binding protein